jgi:hypothetical protein
MNCPYRKLALERWGIEPSGHGRYALVSRKDGQPVACYLTDNESAATASQPFYDSVTYDLQPRVVPNIRETAEDRYEERLRAKRGL